MKIKSLFTIIILLFFGLTIGCNKDDDKGQDDKCIENVLASVTAVNAPSTAMVNETINIEVSFQVFNGCGQFGRFIETQNGNSRTIEVEARYEGCICTQDAPIRKVNYEFVPKNAGNYELNFKSVQSSSITVDITVN